jgi:hypothetical protein
MAKLSCYIQLCAEHAAHGGDSAWDVKQWEHGEFGQFEPMTIHDFGFGPAFGQEDGARPGDGKW